MTHLLLVALLIILAISIIKLSISTAFKIVLYITIASIIIKIMGVMWWNVKLYTCKNIKKEKNVI